MTDMAIKLMISALIGITMGIGSYTFIYAKGYSYVSNSPEVCANCHIMDGHYDGWIKSTHKNVAVCNDCHTPHSLLPKYFAKGLNGFLHSFAFTTGEFHEPIQIKSWNGQIAEDSCRKCHGDMVMAVEGYDSKEEVSCIRCHNMVGHPK